MNATIKERELSNGKSALYLHTFYNGKRTRKSLGLTLYTTPKNQLEKRENKLAYEIAERKRAEAVLEIQDRSVGIVRKDFSKDNFVDYFEKKALERFESKGNYGNWDSSLKHFKKCFGKVVQVQQVDMDLVHRFKNYLEFEAETKSEQPLSQNSRHTYFNKFKACLGQAYRERVIKDNLADYTQGLKQGETQREYLTFEEIKRLIATECRYPILKQAFLFSCYTGLRWSDVQKLKWTDLRHDNDKGYQIIFKQKKTGGQEYLPINESAVALLPDQQEAKEKVFIGLKYSAYHNVALFKWVAEAGIHKRITFHCARHTNAVLLLENGADIYTVSKLLGHKSISTTQIYAKIVDSKKMEAVNNLPSLLKTL